jgi:hypothetical protein
MAIGGAVLVVVSGTSHLDRGHGLWFGEGTGQRHWQRWRCGGFRGEGAFGGFGGLAGQGALVTVMAAIALGHVGVVNGTVVPVVGVPLWQYAVGVMAIDMGSRAPTTPVAHSQAVEAEPLCSHICTHHVAWTTPSDDNCRQAVDGT